MRIPKTPFVVLFGLVVVAGLMAYLILQVGKPLGESASQKVETDPRPDLPGEFVDLPAIYGDATDPHVTRNVDFVADGNSNPPAGGPMWGNGSCPDDPEDALSFCGGAPWGVFRKPWAPETLNHNMEHAGVAVWYNTSHLDFIKELEDLVTSRLRRGDLLVMTPYFDMEEETIALTSWSRIEKFVVSEYSEDRVEEYIDAHVCRYDAEGFC